MEAISATFLSRKEQGSFSPGQSLEFSSPRFAAHSPSYHLFCGNCMQAAYLAYTDTMDEPTTGHAWRFSCQISSISAQLSCRITTSELALPLWLPQF